MIINDIYWQRANVTLVFNKPIKNDVYLINSKNKIKLDYIDNKVTFNVTNTPEGKPLMGDSYNIEINNELVTIDDNVLKCLLDKSRNFKFEKYTEVCTVDFNIDESRLLTINVDYFKKDYRYCNEKKSIKKRIRQSITPILVLFMNLFYHFVRIFKVGKNNVLFLSENSDKLDGNLKVLYEKYTLLKDYKIRKYTKDFFHIKGRLTRIKHIIYVISKTAKSDIIIVDNYIPTLTQINFSKKIRFVQLWHAGVGFKSVGYARFGLEGSPNPFKSSHRKYTDAIVDQDKLIDIYKEVYGVSKDIFKSYGMPRLEGYLSKNIIDETINKIYEEYPILKNKKTIMFSPTYRGSGSIDANYDYNKIDLDRIYSFCKKYDFVFIIKMHSFIKEKINIKKEYNDRIIDLSSYDINKLIYITDIMITDYSSCAYEYSLFDRPLVFYRYDKSFYEFTRPMHTVDEFTTKQYETQTFDELIKVLEKLSNVDIKDRFKNIKDKNNNNSCEKIIKLLK